MTVTTESIVDHVINLLPQIDHGEQPNGALWFTLPRFTKQMCLFECYMAERTGIFRPVEEAVAYARDHGIPAAVARGTVLLNQSEEVAQASVLASNGLPGHNPLLRQRLRRAMGLTPDG